VKDDLARRAPQSRVTGRPSTPVEVILRMLIIKHLYDWSYADTERFVGDSLVLRQFSRLGLQPAPDDTTLLRWANLIQPETLHRLLDRVTTLARQRQVTRGRKLRTDSTVVETMIHHPSNSTLLADGVRVLSRLIRQARGTLLDAEAVGKDLFRDRNGRRLELCRDSAPSHLCHRRVAPAYGTSSAAPVPCVGTRRVIPDRSCQSGTRLQCDSLSRRGARGAARAHGRREGDDRRAYEGGPGAPLRPAGDSRAPGRGRTVLECLHVILDEEWERSRYANRDLAILEARQR
jgi:hypothetical protein